MTLINDFGWSDTWWPLIISTAIFVILHVVAVLRVEPVFNRAFKLSRAGAAFILTTLGFAAFFGGIDHWKEAFLYRHEPGDWMRTGLVVVYGHILADFIWMVVGKYKYNITPRIDLIIHHALGLVGFGAALLLGVGYAFGLLTMVTELMPLSTGLGAWGKMADASKVVKISNRARLHVLAWLRLPLWISLLTLIIIMLISGGYQLILLAYLVPAFALVGLISLDIFWIGKCLQQVESNS